MPSPSLCKPLRRLPSEGVDQEGGNHGLPWQVQTAVVEFIRELLSSGSQSCQEWDVVGHIFNEFGRISGRLVRAERDSRGFAQCLGCAESSCGHPWPWRPPRCRAVVASTAIGACSKWPLLMGVCAAVGGGVGGWCGFAPGRTTRDCVCSPRAEQSCLPKGGTL